MSLRVVVVGLTDRGRVRARNEDAFLIDPELHLAVLADGMGGHRAGHIASALAAAELRSQLTGAGPLPKSLGAREGSQSPLGERMAQAVLDTDARVRVEAATDPERRGMGTTLTALVVQAEEERVVIGHVGDSRAYVYEERRLRQLTRDHTWVQEQVDFGTLSPDAVRGHPHGHVLLQGVGVGDEIKPDVIERDARAGQVYLVCTDGLTNMLTDSAIERILEDRLLTGLDAAARALVTAANSEGGIDNITVVLVSVEGG